MSMMHVAVHVEMLQYVCIPLSHRIGAKIWNSVPPDIWKLSKHNFKKKLLKLLLKLLSLEDTYVDVLTLISRLLQYS